MIRWRNDACRKWRDHLVEAVCGELAGQRRRELETHLESCSRCRAQLAGFERATARVAAALPPRPRPGAIDLWPRIAAALDEEDRRRSSPASQPRPLVLGYGAAAAFAGALLLLGLGLGVWLRAPAPVPAPGPDIAGADNHPEAGFARFLERSTPLLLAVANRRLGGPEAASFDAAAERRLAESLAKEALDLAAALEDAGLRRQAALLRELEIVFLQLSNLPEPQYRHGLAMVQATLESRALLFQLSVEEMRRL